MNGAGLISCPICDAQYSTLNLKSCPVCHDKPLPPKKHKSSTVIEAKPAKRKSVRKKEPLKQHELRNEKYKVIMMTINKPRISFRLTDKIKHIQLTDPTFTAPSLAYCKRLYKNLPDDFLLWLMGCDPDCVYSNPLQREILKDLRLVIFYHRKINPYKFTFAHTPYIALMFASLGFAPLGIELLAERAVNRLKDNHIFPSDYRLS